MNAEENFSVGFSLSDVSETDHFVARQDELAEMHKTLSSKDINDMRRTIVLHGLGGIGKTQLAVAYAKRHRADYSAIFWLNIKDEDSLKQSFARVARRILREHPSASRLEAVTEDSKLDEVVDAVKRWLDHPKNTRWLVVYDNYDNPKLAGNTDRSAIDICRFLPEAYHGSIVITTRSAQVGIGHRVRLDKLKNVQDSLQILSNASRREGVMDGKLSLMLGDAELTLQIPMPSS
jgi:ATP/maltotriose-dependent transcriptional regulator MalT